MLVLKAVSKAVLILALAFSLAAEAQRGSTVGDLLAKINSGSKIKKKKRNLPKFKRLKAKKRRNLQKVKPPKSSKLYYDEGTNEAELEKITDQGISQLFGLTRKFKNSKKRGELWLRLAELYIEKARLIEYRLQTNFEKKMQLYEEKKLKKRPSLSFKQAKVYNKKAIQLYEWFVRDFPKDPKMDQALFFLGYNHFELGNVKKGQFYYKRLSREFPKSDYIYETNFALGEYYFEIENWKLALNYFSKVAKNKRNRLYAFAVYKKAWTEYKLGKYKQALANIEKVIYLGRKSKSSSGKTSSGVSAIRLANEALRDLIIFYVEARSYKNAKGYFERVAGEKSSNVLYDKLANYYLDRGNRTAARYIFGELIQKDPQSRKAFDYQYKIVTQYATAGNDKVFRKELFKWIENFGPGSAWYNVHKNDEKLASKSVELAETTLRNYTLQLHQTAQNSRGKYSQNLAKNSYDLYFSTFFDSEKAVEMRFFYGELLYELKDYIEAVNNYTYVVEKDKGGKYYRVAMVNAILALEKKLPSPQEIKKIVGDTTEPVEFDDNIKRFEKLASDYFDNFPKGQNRVEIEYKLATLYYSYNQFDKALSSFDRVIREYPKTKYAEYSANLTLDIYNLRNDYVGLESAAEKILSVPGMSKTNLGKQVKDIKLRSAFKRAEGLEKSKDYGKAAESYAQFSKNNVGTALSVKAAFNAAVNFEKSDNILGAIPMYEQSQGARGKQNAKIRKESQKALALLYQKTGQYKKAARTFEAFARAYPKDKESLDYVYNAAIIRDGLKNYKTASANFELYYKKSKKSDRFESLYYLGKIWEKRGNIRRAIGYYEQYMNSGTKNSLGVVEVSYILAELYGKLKNTKKSEDWYRKTIRVQKNLAKRKKKVGVRYAAESLFKLSYKTYLELKRIKIPKNQSKQSKAVQKKLNLLQQLKEELKIVIAYDDAHQIVAALAVQGQALQHLAAAIYNAPVPKSLKADELKIYKQEIEKLAKPLQLQAIDSYSTAVERGMKLSGYNKWLKLAQKELSRINPDKYFHEDFKAYFLTSVTRVGDYNWSNYRELLDKTYKDLAKSWKNTEALNALAIYHYENKRPKMAELILTRALEESRKEPALHNNLGVVLIEQGDTRGALLAFQDARALDSSSKEALLNSSSIYVTYGDYKKAEGALDRVASKFSGDQSLGGKFPLRLTNNSAVAKSSLRDFSGAKSLFSSIESNKETDVEILLNYAILLTNHLNDKEEANKIISKTKALTKSRRIKSKLSVLEKKLGDKK